MKRTGWIMLTFVAALLTGCPDNRLVVNFDTAPQILRGSWNFVLKDSYSTTVLSTQAVEFTPTFVSDSRYTVTALVTLEGEVFALSGEVNGKRDIRFVRSQTAAPSDTSMTLIGQNTGKIYRAWTQVPGQAQSDGRWSFGGFLSNVENGVMKDQRLEIIRN